MRPGTALFLSAALLSLVGALAFFEGFAEFIFLLFLGILGFAALVDLFLCAFFMKAPRVERYIDDILALGEETRVRIVLRRGSSSLLSPRLRIFDRWPDSFRCESFPRLVRRRDWHGFPDLAFDYPIVPLERGSWAYRDIDLLLGSPLGFWRRLIRVPLASQGRTYPDFKRLVRQAAAELRGKTAETGIREIRRRGQGLEFHSLRDYVPGDQIRSIDWRATARRGKAVVKEYQDEEDQHLYLLIDSGYRLYPKDGELRLFDHALNAALFLARTALKRGDAVAVSCFGNSKQSTPFRKGLAALNVILNTFHDQMSAPVPSSPVQALEESARRLAKRCFIILVSRLRAEDGEALLSILPRISKRHLLLCVNIADNAEEALIRDDSQEDELVLAREAAHRDHCEREALYRSLEKAGLMILEVPAASLAPAMAARYLALKGAGIL